MTKQETFDKVACHLLTQNAKSLFVDPEDGSEVCAYRGVDGLKCAVGALIPDELYSPAMENVTVNGLLDLRFEALHEHIQHVDLLCDLQSIHDVAEVFEWPCALRSLAKSFGLNSSVVDEIERERLAAEVK